MNSSSKFIKCFIGTAVLASSGLTSAAYADACQVQYKNYSTNTTETVSLKLGQTKHLNKRVKWVKNVGKYGFDVEFRVTGAAMENFTMGSKSPHNRNPAAGQGDYWNHIAKHHLRKITCKKSRTFTEITNNLRHMSDGAEQIAKVGKDLFDMGGKAMTESLEAMGFAANVVAKAIRDVYGPSVSQIASWMKYAGYPVKQIVIALKKIGYQARIVAKALHDAGMASALEAYYFIADVYGGTVSQIATWLKYARYGVKEIASALRKGAELSALEAFKILHETLNFSRNVAIDALRAAGYTAKEIADQIEGSSKNCGVAGCNPGLKVIEHALNKPKIIQ